MRHHENIFKRVGRQLWYSLIFQYCNGVLTLTDAESVQLRNAFPACRNKILTVRNPYITCDNLLSVSKENSSRSKKPAQLLAAGRLQRQKRFDILLKAFARVREKQDCRLVILGEGEEREALQALSLSLGIDQSIEMPGFVSNVHEWLAKSDLFVLSSDYEGLPAVVLESLAHNCPVVTTNCFLGAKELLSGASRCMVTPIRDADALAEAVSRSLAEQSSTGDLHRIARAYHIDEAIDSHVSAISELVFRENLRQKLPPSDYHKSHTQT